METGLNAQDNFLRIVSKEALEEMKDSIDKKLRDLKGKSIFFNYDNVNISFRLNEQ